MYCLNLKNASAYAFTGPQPPRALEEAHLYLYSENPGYDLKGGLLLRCDLHALFDRRLITVDPETWTIRVTPELRLYPDLAKFGQTTGPATGRASAAFQVRTESRNDCPSGVE